MSAHINKEQAEKEDLIRCERCCKMYMTVMAVRNHQRKQRPPDDDNAEEAKSDENKEEKKLEGTKHARFVAATACPRPLYRLQHGTSTPRFAHSGLFNCSLVFLII